MNDDTGEDLVELGTLLRTEKVATDESEQVLGRLGYLVGVDFEDLIIQFLSVSGQGEVHVGISLGPVLIDLCTEESLVQGKFSFINNNFIPLFTFE